MGEKKPNKNRGRQNFIYKEKNKKNKQENRMKSIKSQLIEAPIEFHEKTQSTKTGSTFLICTQTITYNKIYREYYYKNDYLFF